MALEFSSKSMLMIRHDPGDEIIAPGLVRAAASQLASEESAYDRGVHSGALFPCEPGKAQLASLSNNT